MGDRSLFSTDNPDIDVDVLDIADLEAGDLQRLQEEYNAIKTLTPQIKGNVLDYGNL